jgi:FecR protein
MERLIFVLYLFAGHLAVLWAEPFEQAEVTKAINRVSLLPPDKPAVRGDVVRGNTGLKTKGDSRAELQFPDLTITRVGSNSLFRFVAGTREIVLDSGTLLFSAPEGAGGGKVSAGAITAAVTGSDFMISNVGRVKVVCLSHKVTVYFTANPKVRTELRPGQMLDITAGLQRKMPRATTINLGKLLATSKLAESGGFRPLPSQAILAQNIARQRKAFSLADTNLTSESAETERGTTESVNSPTEFSSNSTSQTRDTAAAQTARESEEVTSASPTAGNSAGNGNSGNNNNPGNSGNNGNRGNSGNNQNRGNRGNLENRGNSGNNGNRGNRGNNDNRGNRGNVENRGNSGNNGNPGNSGNNENRGNRGNLENRGNSGDNGNPGNSGNNENRGNRGNIENRGNSGNNGNPGNSGNNGNRGNSGNIENRGNSGNNGNPGNSGNNQNRGNSAGRQG